MLPVDPRLGQPPALVLHDEVVDVLVAGPPVISALQQIQNNLGTSQNHYSVSSIILEALAIGESKN